MSTISYEHQNLTDTETTPHWRTSNVVRDDKALGTIIEKISTVAVPRGEYIRGGDLRNQVAYQVRATVPSIEVPIRADMVITEADNPGKYTYLHLLGNSVDCFNIIGGTDGFVVNASQHIPFEKFELSIPDGSQKMIALIGKVEGMDRDRGTIAHQELDPEFNTVLNVFDGCREAAANASPSTIIRERRKKNFVRSILKHAA